MWLPCTEWQGLASIMLIIEATLLFTWPPRMDMLESCALLRAAANPNVVSTDGDGVPPLTLASSRGHLDVVQALIEAGANVDHARLDGATSLMMSAQNGHIEVVRALLAANADPRIVAHGGFTTLSCAKAKNHPAIVALLEARLAELAATGTP